MTHVRIRSAQPDGILVRFEEEFYFSTWQEVFRFIINVEQARGWVGEVKIE